MYKGKKTCKILKDIRKQIAEANDIEYIVEECKYQGDCLGTCPKCEADVRYLEAQLNQRRMLGKAVVLAGISMNVIAANATPMPEIFVDNAPSNNTEVIDSSLVITGSVFDEANRPLIGTPIYIKTDKKNSPYSKDPNTITDVDGSFTLKVNEFPCTILVYYIGYERTEIQIDKNNSKGLRIQLKPNKLNVNENIITEDDEKSIDESLQGIVGMIEATTKITGHVVDDEGLGINGASIKLTKKDKLIETTTDVNGNFTLDGIPASFFPCKIEVYYIGYVPRKIKIKAKDKKDLLIKLKEEIMGNL